ncbi:MAG: hypothetical protein R3182_13235 [Draconibacterium sp.]|nr:hypothetical protein [Draconibacterium sp.]
MSETVNEEEIDRNSDEYLKQLAKDLYMGKVFTSNMINEFDQHCMLSVFMPLLGLDKDMKDMLDNAAFIYEYFDKQFSNRAINGYPIFASFMVMPKENVERLNEYFEKVKKAMEGI